MSAFVGIYLPYLARYYLNMYGFLCCIVYGLLFAIVHYSVRVCYCNYCIYAKLLYDWVVV